MQFVTVVSKWNYTGISISKIVNVCDCSKMPEKAKRQVNYIEKGYKGQLEQIRRILKYREKQYSPETYTKGNLKLLLL